ncbi:RHOMBOID-like protein 12, mitochondrial isoform X1 [Lycium ferocissimum]|uniref:RHOMBOID-like protein 12, mitochondrial isoform X1 n=1 Tax=Lycium ferocissimum TaxID=112874 RepID=UPI002816463E|nr:RHOMBOID-like protein 12, mitochondrial isoform X1 [Lycium ferocissimum]
MQSLLSKIPKNLSNVSKNPSQTFLFLTSKTNQCHPLPQQQHFFSTTYNTFSHSHLWKPQNVKFPHGVFSNPLFSKKVLPNTLFGGDLSRVLVNQTVGVVRTQFGRRIFHSNFPFGSTKLGWRSGFGRFSTDGVVLALILTNVAVFLLWRVADNRFMMRNFMISVANFTSGRIHTLITSAFSHIDAWHLISNMVGLYFFGTSIGRTFGPEFLLKLYLSGAVVGSVFYLIYHAFIAPSLQAQRGQFLSMDPSRVPGLGASGAVNAVLLLDIFLFPKKTLYFDFIIPVPAILLGIFIIGKDVLRILEGDTQISGSAHLGGAVTAAIAWARVRRGRF